MAKNPNNILIDEKTTSTIITLPSRGFLYEDKLPDGQVEVTCTSTRDEQILAGTGGTGSQKMSMILDRCMKLPDGLTANDLLVADRFYAMLVIRALSSPDGSVHQIKIKCPDCGFNYKSPLDILKDIEFNFYDEDEQVSEPFMVDLPIENISIGFRCLRGHDEIAIEKYRDKQLKNNKAFDGDPAYIYMIAKRIVKLNDKEVKFGSDLLDAVGKLTSKDSAILQRAIISKDPGPRMAHESTCPSCYEEFEAPIKLDTGFFRSSES